MALPVEQSEMEAVACDFCGSTEQVNMLKRQAGLDVVEWAECGLAHVNPRPTWEAMLAHYGSSYVADRVEARWRTYVAADPQGKTPLFSFPALRRAFYRLLWHSRRYWNWAEIQDESVHTLTMLGEETRGLSVD